LIHSNLVLISQKIARNLNAFLINRLNFNIFVIAFNLEYGLNRHFEMVFEKVRARSNLIKLLSSYFY